MSEQMMRDALITAREALVLEGYAEDNLAIVRIDEALAQQPAAVVDLTETVVIPAATWGEMMALVSAANRLCAESEEYDFDDGMGRGVQHAYWDEFFGALDKARGSADAMLAVEREAFIAKQGGAA